MRRFKILICTLAMMMIVGCGTISNGNIDDKEPVVNKNENSRSVTYVYVANEESGGVNKSIAINFADSTRKKATITSEVNETNDTYNYCDELQEFIETRVISTNEKTSDEIEDDVHNNWEVIISFENEDATIIERGEKLPDYWEDLIVLMEK